MTTITVAGSASEQGDRDAAIRKVWWRLIPFLFVLYIFNYLDRINIGFAARNNFLDMRGAYRAFYPGPCTAASYSDNWNMVTGAALPERP